MAVSEYDARQFRLVYDALAAYHYSGRKVRDLGQLVQALEGLNSVLESPDERWVAEFDEQFLTLETVFALRLEQGASELEPDQAGLVAEAVDRLKSVTEWLTAVIELPLGAAGLDFVRRGLEEGRSLSRSAREWIVDGEAAGLVPRGTSLERALRFDEGGLVGTNASTRALQSSLGAQMAAPGAVFVGEHPYAQRRDPAVARKGESVSFFWDEVYWWTAVAGEIPQVLRAARAWRANYFVTHAPGGVPEELSGDALAELAARATVVALEAYDDESFVLWRPRGRDAPPPHDRPRAERKAG